LKEVIAVPEPGRSNRSAGKLPLDALGLTGLLAVVGYLSGLAQGEGKTSRTVQTDAARLAG
jgi:hypothetical protein